LLIAVALDHAVRWLQRRGMRRGLAIATVMGAGLVLLVGCGFTIIPPAVAQARALMWEAPRWVHSARGSSVFATLDQRFHIAEQILRAERQIPEMLRGATLPILNAVGGVLSGIAGVVTIAFLAVFMLIFGERLIVSAIAEARPERRSMYEVLLAKVYRSIGGYLGGLVFICTVNATLTTAFLAVIRLPFFLPLGIVAGFSSMVPYAGPFVMGAFISLVALLTGGPWYGLATASYFVLYGQLEGNVLSPCSWARSAASSARSSPCRSWRRCRSSCARSFATDAGSSRCSDRPKRWWSPPHRPRTASRRLDDRSRPMRGPRRPGRTAPLFVLVSIAGMLTLPRSFLTWSAVALAASDAATDSASAVPARSGPAASLRPRPQLWEVSLGVMMLLGFPGPGAAFGPTLRVSRTVTEHTALGPLGAGPCRAASTIFRTATAGQHGRSSRRSISRCASLSLATRRSRSPLAAASIT
jgi:predicted PurR-regulated permease PerM